jgi:signal peptidase I
MPLTDPQSRAAIDDDRARHQRRAAAQFAKISAAVRVVLLGVAIAIGLRAFVYEPFNIPSESMMPVLRVGDYLFVAKWPYGVSRHSLPMAPPLWSGRLFGASPARGDIVVFKSPADNRTDYIKRVIGLPGDRIRMADGMVLINGVAVPRAPLAPFAAPAEGCLATNRTAQGCRVAHYRETLPGGRSYAVIDQVRGAPRDTTPEITVAPGHYFMLGDNRDDSADSRWSIAEGGVGQVPAENLVGRADRIFFSADADTRGPLGVLPVIHFDRIGTPL